MRLLLILFIFSTRLAYSQDFNPAAEYIATNVCPYECCTYEGWQPKQEVSLYETKDSSSKVVALLDADSKVQLITSDWHVMPQKVTILKVNPSYSYKPGDQYWLLDYVGEGEYHAWKDGEFTWFGAYFSPYGEIQKEDWYELEGEYKYTWWLKIQTDAGMGWSNTPELFSVGDGCG